MCVLINDFNIEDSVKLDSIYSCSLSIKMHLIRLGNIIIYLLAGPSL